MRDKGSVASVELSKRVHQESHEALHGFSIRLCLPKHSSSFLSLSEPLEGGAELHEHAVSVSVSIFRRLEQAADGMPGPLLEVQKGDLQLPKDVVLKPSLPEDAHLSRF